MRDSQPWGQVKIRQVYSRAGRNYCAVSMPIAAMRLLKWRPGMLLTYYPTKSGGLTFILASELLRSLDDFNPADGVVEAEGEEFRGPREGSMAARALDVDDKLEDMAGGRRVTGYDAAIARMEARMLEKEKTNAEKEEGDEEAEQKQDVRSRRHGKGSTDRGRRRGR